MLQIDASARFSGDSLRKPAVPGPNGQSIGLGCTPRQGCEGGRQVTLARTADGVPRSFPWGLEVSGCRVPHVYHVGDMGSRAKRDPEVLLTRFSRCSNLRA